MKSVKLLAIFDSHTPYLAFRLNAFQKAIEKRGLTEKLELHIVLIGAEEASYGWEGDGLQSLYQAPIHVLSKQFRGLGMKTFFHPSVPGCLWKLLKLLLKLRPKITFVGGYDRPESMLATMLNRFWGGKTGVWNDSKFDDAESFSRSVTLEFIKSLMVARYHFYMCTAKDSVDYHRFLGGRKKLALEGSWDVVDNDAIGIAADDDTHDAEIWKALDLAPETPFFLMPVRFVEKKNVSRVIDAYARYAKRHREPVKLVICGKGPLEESMRKAIAKEGLTEAVQIVPWLPYERVPRACRLSRAMMLASTHDQWGMIVNEALAAGAPVLVSHRCGAQALVKNHINGFTFDPFDTEHMSQLFGVMAEQHDLVKSMREAAAPSMKDFSIDTWINNHFAVLEHYDLLKDSSVVLAETSTSP